MVLVRLTTMQVLIKKEMWSPGLWNLQLSFQCKRCDFSFISVSTVKLNKLCCGLLTAGWEFCKCSYFCCPCEKSSFRSKQVQFNSPAQTQTLQHYEMKLQRISLLSAELFFLAQAITANSSISFICSKWAFCINYFFLIEKKGHYNHSL